MKNRVVEIEYIFIIEIIVNILIKLLILKFFDYCKKLLNIYDCIAIRNEII